MVTTVGRVLAPNTSYRHNIHMRIYLSHSDYLRNFESFLRAFNTENLEVLNITTHTTWINVHPVILTMIAALAKATDTRDIIIDNITAKSGHYLDRMGLFKFLDKPSPFSIEIHESAGRFIPLTQIRTQVEQSRFITDMVPLLHLAPEQADALSTLSASWFVMFWSTLLPQQVPLWLHNIIQKQRR